jgi:hypothetical protein
MYGVCSPFCYFDTWQRFKPSPSLAIRLFTDKPFSIITTTRSNQHHSHTFSIDPDPLNSSTWQLLHPSPLSLVVVIEFFFGFAFSDKVMNGEFDESTVDSQVSRGANPFLSQQSTNKRVCLPPWFPLTACYHQTNQHS